MALRVTVLGSGTSSGIPLIGCTCSTCTSDDPRDKRTRASVLVELSGKKILIDTSSDFRQQMLRHHIAFVDAVIFTHHHFDHISGFDDLRAFNFHTHQPVPCFGTAETIVNLRRIFAYAFGDGLAPGTAAPKAFMHTIEPGKKFQAAGIEILPVPLKHGSLDVMGFRIENFAYATDCNAIPETSLEMLRDLDVLILDALRYKHHPTHFSLDEAIAMAQRIGAKKTFFTHIAHEMQHRDVEKILPENFVVAFDGMVVEF